ncbi:MAG: hypothetical protein AB7S55_07995 [Thiomonas sp.]
MQRSRPLLGLTLLGSLLLTACGGGGSSAQYEGSIVTGQVLMGPQYPGDTSGGPVAGATVCAYAFLANGSPLYTINYGALPYTYNITPAATCQTTTANGSFSFNLLNGVYGPVLLQAYGGSYQFGASSSALKSYTLNQLTSANLSFLTTTSTNYFIASNTTLQAVVNVGGGGTVSTNVTPLTTFAVARGNPVNGFTVATYQNNLSNVAAQLGISGVANLATAVPGAPTSDPNASYGQAMLGVAQYLATMTPNGTNTDDPYGANLLNWTNLATVSADYTAAYRAINSGSTATFSFN